MRHIALLLCALFVCVFAQTDKKIVQVNLVANWQEAPLQYEISEFLKENEPKLLWNLLKDVQSDKSEDFLSYCKQHLSNEQYSLLEYALTIHYFAPKLQIQRQLHNEALASLSESLQTKAKSCSSWILINNQVACTADELNSLLRYQTFLPQSNPQFFCLFFRASCTRHRLRFQSFGSYRLLLRLSRLLFLSPLHSHRPFYPRKTHLHLTLQHS